MSIIEKAIEKLEGRTPAPSLIAEDEPQAGFTEADAELPPALTVASEPAADLLQPPTSLVGEPGASNAADSPPEHPPAGPRSQGVEAASLARALEEKPPGEPAGAPDARRPPGGAGHTRHEVQLDLERLAGLGIVTPNTSNTALAEQHRMIKRPLLDRATLDGLDRLEHDNLIIITSSLPGEGKTFISINLAMSMAMEVDRTVLLVDADIHKSDVSRILGLERVEGLTDHLQEGIPLEDLFVKTSVPKLSVLPAGRHYPHLTELMASEQMRALTLELSTRYRDRIILFDSPPLLATTGAAVLTGLMGQVVMVVEAVRTPQSAVQEALRLVGARPNVGTVLNKSRQRSGTGYNYGYYYGYGGYGRS